MNCFPVIKQTEKSSMNSSLYDEFKFDELLLTTKICLCEFNVLNVFSVDTSHRYSPLAFRLSIVIRMAPSCDSVI